MGIPKVLAALAAGAALLTACSGVTPTPPEPVAATLPATTTVAAVATAPAPTPSVPASAPIVKPQGPTTDATTTSRDGKFFGYLKKVTLKGEDVVVTVDYAQMLTGKEAVDAAKAHGYTVRGDNVENDYYIVNDNPKLRTFTLAKSASVRYLVGGEPALHTTSAIGFLGKWENGAGGADILRDPYWLTIEGGVIVVLEQQYLP